MKPECKRLLRELQEMKTGKSRGTAAPHKAVLLMAVLDLIDQDAMSLHRIEYNTQLKGEFVHKFDEIIGTQKYVSAAEPFWHLRTSPFWVHHVRPGMEAVYDATSTSGGGDKRIREIIDHASFAYYARRALMDKNCLKCVRKLLFAMCNERKGVTSKLNNMDVHFYLDNAPPKEVIPLLSLLSDKEPVTPAQADSMMIVHLGRSLQADKTYSLRRLLDLGLAERVGRGGGYILNERGKAVQAIFTLAYPVGVDVLHYLHFTPFAGLGAAGARVVEQYRSLRKYLWSYRRCCEVMWSVGSVVAPRQLAAQVQAEMEETFPWIDFSQFSSGEARAGGRFNATAVGAVVTWLRALEPSPIPEGGKEKRLIPREVDRVELALLALDDVYRARGYAYGDPVIMDEALVRQAAGVFFLDEACCARLIQLAARLFPRRLTARSTLEGTMLVLHGPYTVLDVAAGLG